MTILSVSHWTRRDAADRAMLGQVTFDVCKALRASGAVDDARFYWAAPDTVVLQVSADSAEPLMNPPSADAARHLFALADLAHRDNFEQWIDPRTGMENYELAGR